MKRCIRTACGAALCATLYAVLARFAVITCGAGHIRLQFVLLGVAAALLGPGTGLLLGLAGSILADVIAPGGIGWSQALGAAAAGAVVGYMAANMGLKQASTWKKLLGFAVCNAAAHAFAWLVITPVLDVLAYGAATNVAFVQGAQAVMENMLTAVTLGTLLYAGWIRLMKDNGR